MNKKANERIQELELTVERQEAYMRVLIARLMSLENDKKFLDIEEIDFWMGQFNLSVENTRNDIKREKELEKEFVSSAILH